ncbi:trace amine-associated receptor 13c-like [Stegastes partitus]|uniref:Trace amine-associated receptor 13c-like n=1 Tax=Stegastes partitus TaxID=144197 RepID=A0A9Y4NB86_9TELE|nr:PREDICTED: trace amine-associated receptor 13c-like [Stegastes partitus]
MKTLEEAELCFPQLRNSSCRKTMRPYSVSMILYIILSCISLLTVILNLLVIISISHFKQLHTPTNLLLLSLAVSDCFVGLLVVFQILLLDGCWYFGELTCVLYYIFDYVITSASIGTMVLISIDRFVAICYPLHYLSKATQQRTKICVSLCWMCAALCHCLILKDNLKQPGRYSSCAGECVVVLHHVAGSVDLFLSFVGPVTVIVVLYVRVFVVAVSQARAMRSDVTAFTLQGSVNATVKKSELKAATTLGVVIVVFLICLCPYFCATLTGQDVLLNSSSMAFVICLFYFNSLLNPLIYGLFYPWFRKSIKLIITFQILRSGSCDAQIM